MAWTPCAPSGSVLTLLVGVVLLGCTARRPSPPAPTPKSLPPARVIADASEYQAQALQPIFGYTVGPLTVGDDWIRRTYFRAGAQIEVTLALRMLNGGEYEEWYQQARHYPPAWLPFPTDQSIGFFTCAGDGGVPPCALHGQTREGLHMEVSGDGLATRADLENLLALLAWK
jgi:hypothetical protein